MSKSSAPDNLKKAIEVGVDDVSQPTAVYRPEVDTSSIDERRLMRKIDLRVVPWLAVLYLLNFLDRGNIGNARVRRRSIHNAFASVPLY